jgi:glucosamine--fructose-6-phosphate aminotransferase (isomerizing)
VECCGIIAVVGNEPAVNILVEGLKILEARGYDSAGISTVDQKGALVTTKFASSGSTSNAIQILEAKSSAHNGNVIGIAHTRWATHGGATDVNAHPHHDSSDRVAVVHNGVIENNSELKEWLQKEHNIKFRSQTDTEVISQLIGLNLRDGKNIQEAVISSIEKLEGTWGLAILDKETPDRILVAKNGSPLLIGVAEGRTFVASEPSAFARYTKNFIGLQDREVAVITAKGHSLDDSRVKVAEVEKPELSPAPWPNWTIKEIMEQPQAISRALNYGGRLSDDSAKLGGLDKNKESLKHIHNLVIAACGTSYFSGLAGAQIMRYMRSFDTIQVMDAAEITEADLPLQNGGLLVISQSGETKDVHRAMQVAMNKGLPVVSVVNVVGSLIARSTGVGVYVNAGRENAVASTKAFTCQVTVLALIALWFSKLNHAADRRTREALSESLQRLPTSVGMLLKSPAHDQIKVIAKNLIDRKVEHMFVLGKGPAMPIALEGALKIKEISYIHAEGYPGGALKHGPFALITQGMPIIFVILDDDNAPKMITAVEEVRARGAHTITITNIAKIFKNRKDMGDIIHVPGNGPMSGVLCVIPMQLLAYELSILQGINPDRPRHLAKTVTVD